ncbi:MAG TPA: SpoIIIAH-like family protein [Bacilli bacterium]|nr:SpoIIIAH-like family protein [Bacilli bacterium]
MVLKKQTVWLLTMLSLIIVLSVYYLTNPGDNAEFVLGDKEAETEDTDTDKTTVDIEVDEEQLGEEANVVSSSVSDDVFTSLKLDRQANRDRMQENYTNIVASTDVSEELRAEASEKRENLMTLDQKENMLESLIKAKGYDDVLVITEENQVKVIVQADELSREQAVEIMKMTNEQLGQKEVAVGHQPTNKK